MIIVTILYAIFYPNSKFNSIILMIDGTLISIWITNFFNIVNSIKDFARNLNRNFTTISTMLQVLASLYDLFVLNFPYNDTLFRKDGYIIYITPYAQDNETVLQKNSATIFINYFQSISEKKLLNTFDDSKAEQLAINLSREMESLHTAHSLILTCKDFLPGDIIDLFEQAYSLVDKIVDFYQKYKNLDMQLRRQCSILYSAYIYKLTVTILILQDEQALYKQYIKFISHPPLLKTIKSLEEAIKKNKKLGY